MNCNRAGPPEQSTTSGPSPPCHGAAFDESDSFLTEAWQGDAGTRTNPASISVDLTDAAYQGISEITFRYYPLSSDTGLTVELNDLSLHGDVIPEPASLALLGLGGVMLMGRRRRCPEPE